MGMAARRIDGNIRMAIYDRNGREEVMVDKEEEEGGKDWPGIRRELEDSRGPAKDLDYHGSIQLASRRVKYYCPPRFIH